LAGLAGQVVAPQAWHVAAAQGPAPPGLASHRRHGAAWQGVAQRGLARKRPKMGQVAARHSDVVIVTSDNPRTENPQTILTQIEQGIQSLLPEERCSYQIIADRADAIQAAVSEAKDGDLLLIAGKGHEDYQILGTQKIHFDDREEARKAIHRQMGSR
jgi:UDP-N-acetylmuramoyl-L-alanyl-D-glutamate--2,6-diaminopimelate ligase